MLFLSIIQTLKELFSAKAIFHIPKQKLHLITLKLQISISLSNIKAKVCEKYTRNRGDMNIYLYLCRRMVRT